MITATAVRPLRTAIIVALKAAATSAGDSVYTPPVAEGAGFPRIVLDGYMEDPRNFFGRGGSWVRCQVKGQVRSMAGDAPRELLWQEVYEALNGVALAVTGHLLLEGKIRRTATYMDPDGITLHFVGTYEAETRLA